MYCQNTHSLETKETPPHQPTQNMYFFSLSHYSLQTQATTPAVPFYTLSSPTYQPHSRAAATSTASIPPHLTPHTPSTPSTPTLESPTTPITPVQKQPSKGLKVTVCSPRKEELNSMYTQFELALMYMCLAH